MAKPHLQEVQWDSSASITAYQNDLENWLDNLLQKVFTPFFEEVYTQAVEALSSPSLVASGTPTQAFARVADPFAFTTVMRHWYSAIRKLTATNLEGTGVTLETIESVLQEANLPSRAYEDVAALLHESRHEGWTPYQTKRALSKLLIPKESSGRYDSRAKYRKAISDMARTIATETLGIQSQKGIQRRGFTHKMWLAHKDTRVRHTHLAAHHQVVPVGESFTVGGHSMPYPGYKLAPAHERINCRCTMKGVNTVPTVSNEIEGDSLLASGAEENPSPTDTPTEGEDTLRLGVWQGVLVSEGIATGDGRKIAPNALRWENLPISLRIVESDVGAHDGAQVAGTIQTIERIPSKDVEGAYDIVATGTFDLDSPVGLEAYRKVDEELMNGVSVDLDDMSFEVHRATSEPVIEETSTDYEVVYRSTESEEVHLITDARIRAATLVSIPAFANASIEIIESEDSELDESLLEGIEPVELEDAEDSKDTKESEESEEILNDFNWVDEAGGLPKYIRRIAKALQRKGMGESQAIATAVNTVKKWAKGGGKVSASTRAKAVKALAEWAAKRARARAKNSADSLTASGAIPTSDAPPNAWFADPQLSEPTALRVTAEGRVYGHLATWDTCHIGQADYCVTPPSSVTNYAYFHTGAVITAENHEVAVGHIVLGTTHASGEKGVTATMAHYDNTGLAVADVRAGEDAYGIWVAGSLRAGVAEEDVKVLRSSPLSGDWRRVQGNLELVSALAVNLPGFPIPRPQGTTRDGDMFSLVASGMVAPRQVPKPESEHAFSVEDVRYLKSLLRKERSSNVARMARKINEGRVKAFAQKVLPDNPNPSN